MSDNNNSDKYKQRSQIFNNLIGNLLGGNLNKAKQLAEEGKEKFFDVYFQFDKDEPILLYDNVGSNESIELVISHVEGDNFIIFTDPETGKKFKIFTSDLYNEDDIIDDEDDDNYED